MSKQLINEGVLTSVIRSFLSMPAGFDRTAFGEGARGNSRLEQSSGESWLNALRWCPEELLDLINSKACRGE